MLRECLKRLENSAKDISSELIVVDNGSTDDTIELLKSEFADVRLIENTSNLGFPKAVNQGIVASRGEFVALVNSDIMVPAHALELLKKELVKDSVIAAVGPQLEGRSGHLQFSGGFQPSLTSSFHMLLGDRFFREKNTRALFIRSQQDLPIDVEWLCAACMIVRREAIDDVGLFDESHFLYAEDVEYGLRLHDSGWKLRLVPKVRVLHYGGESSAKVSEINLLWLAGIFRIAAGRLSRPQYAVFGATMAAAYGLRSVLITVKNTVLRNWKLNEEVSSAKQFRAYAKTSLDLGRRRPEYASELCKELEKKYY